MHPPLRRDNVALLIILALVVLSVGCDLDEPDLAAPTTGVQGLLLCDQGRTVQVVSDNAGLETATVAVTGNAPSSMLLRGERLYVLNSLSNDVRVFDTSDWTEETAGAPWGCGARTNPIAMAFGPDDRLWIACFLSNEVLAMDANNGTIVQRIDVAPGLPTDTPGNGSRPRPNSVYVFSGRVYVTLANLKPPFEIAGGPGALDVFDAASGAHLERRILNVRNPGSILADPIDPARIYISGRGDFEPGQGFIGNGAIEVLDLPSGQTATVIPIGGAPGGIAFAENGRAFVANGRSSEVLVFDWRNWNLLPSLTIPPPVVGDLSYASALALDASQRLWILEFNSSRLYLYDPDSLQRLQGPIGTDQGPVDLLFPSAR